VYGLRGLKASELIRKLERLIERHGDLIVVHHTGDEGYPEGIQGVSFQKADDRVYDVKCFLV
jgi:hypothetical protein